MKIIESNPFGKINIAELEIFEKSIGEKLPEGYRSFLIEHNGGRPEPRYFKMGQSVEEIHGSFYGLHNGPNYSRLDLNYMDYTGRIPRQLIAIAGDPGGNQICIDTGKLKTGAVYFWDHEKEIHPENDVEFISENFGVFLSSFLEWRPPTSEITTLIEQNQIEGIKEILDRGFDPETIVSNNRTMIEIAAIHNKLDVIKLLHERGARPRAALQLAEKNAKYFGKHKESVALIKALFRS